MIEVARQGESKGRDGDKLKERGEKEWRDRERGRGVREVEKGKRGR